MGSRIFAYGSNMCSGKLIDEGVLPTGPGIPAKLNNHILVFNKKSKKDGSGKANLIGSEGTTTWGVLYDISDDYLRKLDENEGPGYERKPVDIQRKSGEYIGAEAYIARRQSKIRLLPYSWYKRFLVLGGWEHRLPIEYIVTLQGIEAEEDPNQNRDRDRRSLACEKLTTSKSYIAKCLKYCRGIKLLLSKDFQVGDCFNDPHLMKSNEYKIVQEVKGGNIYATDGTGPYPKYDSIIIPTTEQLLDGCCASSVDLCDDVPGKRAKGLFDAILKTSRFQDLNGK